MGIGAAGYFIAFTLFALNRTPDSYWPFLFPGLLFITLGADLEFNVANLYVLSSMEQDKQAIAGAILQTSLRLASVIGFGIATALYYAVSKSPPKSGYYGNNAAAPYAAAFWLASGFAAFSFVLVFFLRVGTQGNEVQTEIVLPVGAVGVEMVVAEKLSLKANLEQAAH